MQVPKWQSVFAEVYDYICPKIVEPLMLVIGVLFIPFVYVQMNFVFIYFVNVLSVIGLCLVFFRMWIKRKKGL